MGITMDSGDMVSVLVSMAVSGGMATAAAAGEDKKNSPFFYLNIACNTWQTPGQDTGYPGGATLAPAIW